MSALGRVCVTAKVVNASVLMVLKVLHATGWFAQVIQLAADVGFARQSGASILDTTII
jgi:hypothetical protein